MSKGLLGHANHRGLLALAIVFLVGVGLALGSTPAVAQHSAHNADHAAPMIAGDTGLLGARFLDVEGRVRVLGDETGPGGFGFVFISDGCQNSMIYAAELSDLAVQARADGIDLYAVITSPRMTWTEARALKDALSLRLPTLFDPSGELTTRMGVEVTPEAVLISADDHMVYRGRIDDRFVGLGQRRTVIRSHDLKAAMARLAQGDLRRVSTQTVGCWIEDRRPPADRPVSYHRDVAPLLAANCNSCHRVNGSAPFRLDTPAQATSRAWMIADVTQTRYMPPWKAEPHLGRFRDERRLSNTQIDMLARWFAAGAPLGDPQQAAPPTQQQTSRWPLGEPDVVLAMAEPFDIPAQGEDIYRYFVLPGKLANDLTLRAIDFLPGDPGVVHHANFFIDFVGKAAAEDAKDAQPGFSVFGTGSFMDYSGSSTEAYGIGGWAPGAEPYQTPQDTGIWLGKGGQLVIEVHYKLNGKATQDRSQLGLYLAKEPVKHYLDGLLVGTQDIEIEPGDRTYGRHVSMTVPQDFHLVDLMPHMHYIGTRARVHLTHPDGRVESLIGIEDWDLRWQNIYVLREPRLIEKGSRLDFWFEWDNSDDNFSNPHYPAQPMTWGWGSDQEMAEVWMGIIPKDWRNTRALNRAANRTWYRADNQPIPQ